MSIPQTKSCNWCWCNRLQSCRIPCRFRDRTQRWPHRSCNHNNTHRNKDSQNKQLDLSERTECPHWTRCTLCCRVRCRRRTRYWQDGSRAWSPSWFRRPRRMKHTILGHTECRIPAPTHRTHQRVARENPCWNRNNPSKLCSPRWYRLRKDWRPHRYCNRHIGCSKTRQYGPRACSWPPMWCSDQ